MISVHFQGKPFSITVIQAYAPTSNAEEAEIERFYEDLVAQMVKHLPTMKETQVQSQGREVPLEKEMATHSSVLAWRIPWTEEAGRLQFTGSQRFEHD